MNLPLRIARVIPSAMLELSLAMASWVCWTGCLLVTGQLVPRYSAGEVRALMGLPHAHAAPRAGLSMGDMPPCHPPTSALNSGANVQGAVPQ